MAILSGRDFGVRFPTGGGVANNNFGNDLSAALLGQAMQNQRQDQVTQQSNQRQDQLIQAQNQRADQAASQESQKAQAVSDHKIRLDQSLLGLTRVFKMAGGTVPEQDAQRSAFNRFAAEQIELGANAAPFIKAMNAGSFDEFNMLVQGQLDGLSAETGRVGEALELMNPQQGNNNASAKSDFFTGGERMILPNREVIYKNTRGEVVEGEERVALMAAAAKSDADRKNVDANRTVTTAQKVADAKFRSSRISAMTKTFGDSRRGAQMSSVGLREAAKLVENSTQGFSGSAKLQLSKIFPSIDVSNEAGLESSLKRLSLDQLQKFKGPTTDFEFRVTEDIAGKLGDSQSANRARIAALQRNNYFVREQAEQFQTHVSAGGDPETYDFNFGKAIKIGKKAISLRDLQDTAVFHNISIDEAIRRFKQ
jgi:hypothetical protein